MSSYFQILATTPLDIKRASHRVSCGCNSGKKYYLSSSEGCSQTYSDLRERLMHIADKKKTTTTKKKNKNKKKNKELSGMHASSCRFDISVISAIIIATTTTTTTTTIIIIIIIIFIT